MKVRYYSGDIRPMDGLVFVFGSNPLGINGNPSKGTGGAALVAVTQFGVKQGEKMDNKVSESGKAYGLVTVTAPGRKRSLSRNEILKNFYLLFKEAKSNPDKNYCLAYRNWDKASLNGYTGAEMCSILMEAAYSCGMPDNLVISEEWITSMPLPVEKELIYDFSK